MLKWICHDAKLCWLLIDWVLLWFDTRGLTSWRIIFFSSGPPPPSLHTDSGPLLFRGNCIMKGVFDNWLFGMTNILWLTIRKIQSCRVRSHTLLHQRYDYLIMGRHISVTSSMNTLMSCERFMNCLNWAFGSNAKTVSISSSNRLFVIVSKHIQCLEKCSPMSVKKKRTTGY